MLITTAITAMLACEKSDQTQSISSSERSEFKRINQDTSNNEEREVKR